MDAVTGCGVGSKKLSNLVVDSIHFTTKSNWEMQFGKDIGSETDFNEDSDKMPKKRSFKKKSNASSGKKNNGGRR